jgi:hypothetical protein
MKSRKRHQLTVSTPAFLAFTSLRKQQKTHNSELLLSLVKRARSHAFVPENTNPQRFFLGSGVPELEELTLNERQLLEMAAELSKLPPENLVRAAVIFYAKREILSHKRHEEPVVDAKAEVADETLRPGVAGSADGRMQKAYETLLAMNNPPTPSKIAKRAATAFSAAVRWLQRFHPEHLAPNPDPRRSSPASRAMPPGESTEKIPPPPAPKEAKKPEEPASETEPISIIPFRELSLPGSNPISLAYGALDAKGIAHFSTEPFGQGVLSEAIRSETLKVIAHRDHHLVPISWLMVQVPRQQPFLRRVQNRIRKEARTAKRVRDPEVEPF